MATILVLGGGVGGLIAATELRRHLPKDCRVVLIDREPHHLFAPSLLWVMVGSRKVEAIQRPLSRLAKKRIEVRHGEIEKIDPQRRVVTVAGEELNGDYMVVALGAELADQTVPGLREAGHGFYTPAGAQSLHAALRRTERGRVIVLTAAPAYKCPAAPYEAALLIAAHFASRGLRDAVSIEVWAAEPGPMGVAGPEVSAGVKGLLAAERIPYHPEHQVRSVDPHAKTLHFANGAEVTFDVLAYVPPHRAPAVVRESPLLGDAGWIAVDRHTLATRFPGVYAVGDVTTIPLALGKPLPKAGVFAHGQAEVVARNIAAVISGREPRQHFDGHGECFIEVGHGKAGFGSGDFYAEPVPAVELHPPARRWHAAKVLFEKTWLHTKL